MQIRIPVKSFRQKNKTGRICAPPSLVTARYGYSNAMNSGPLLDGVVTRSNQCFRPEHEAANLNSRQEGSSIFRIPSGNAPPLLEFKKSVFDKVTQFVKIMVIIALVQPIFPWWNHSDHTMLYSPAKDFVCIIASIRKKIIGKQTINQCDSLLTISDGTTCSNCSDWHTIRIHGQMYLCIKPPFVRPISWLPPTAPAACG